MYCPSILITCTFVALYIKYQSINQSKWITTKSIWLTEPFHRSTDSSHSCCRVVLRVQSQWFLPVESCALQPTVLCLSVTQFTLIIIHIWHKHTIIQIPRSLVASPCLTDLWSTDWHTDPWFILLSLYNTLLQSSDSKHYSSIHRQMHINNPEMSGRA